MSTDLMNINAFKGMAPADAFKVLDPQSESLSDGIGSSYGIVGYKGKVWTLRLRGDTKTFLRPDDGSPAPFLDVIILRQLPAKSKSFYPPGSYVDGQVGTRPLCAALDGIQPDADIAKPESPTCAICPRNVFKTAADGRKTRDCSDYKRLAVLIVPSQTATLLGAPLMEPVFLRVPAASLNDLALLGEGMSAQGFHFSSYITRIGFNPEKPHPQMTFKALQGLRDQEAAVVLPMREEGTAYRITGEQDVGKARPATVQTAQQDGPTAAELAAGVAAAAAKAAAEQARLAQVEADRIAAHKAAEATQVDAGFGMVTAPVTKPINMDESAARLAMVDAAFGIDQTNQAGPTTVGVTANTDADVGGAEEADDDLDSRIANILPK